LRLIIDFAYLDNKADKKDFDFTTPGFMAWMKKRMLDNKEKKEDVLLNDDENKEDKKSTQK
jgi:hypothetical protein